MFNISLLVKYVLEGLAVAIAAFFIPRRKVEVQEIVLIALTAAAVFAILDQFTPAIGAGARQGAGFGIGLNQVGWGNPDLDIVDDNPPDYDAIALENERHAKGR